jgi:hypothetical protein
MSLFHLNAIDTVDAVNEEDEDEDEGNLEFVSEWVPPAKGELDIAYLHSILQLCYERTLRDVGEQLPTPGEWHRDDEHHEEHHLKHEKQKHLWSDIASVQAGQTVRGWVSLPGCSRESW